MGPTGRKTYLLSDPTRGVTQPNVSRLVKRVEEEGMV